MIELVEAGQAWLENVTFQMCNMVRRCFTLHSTSCGSDSWQSYKEQSKHLAGQIAALKAYLTTSAGEISDMAVNVWG